MSGGGRRGLRQTVPSSGNNVARHGSPSTSQHLLNGRFLLLLRRNLGAKKKLHSLPNFDLSGDQNQ